MKLYMAIDLHSTNNYVARLGKIHPHPDPLQVRKKNYSPSPPSSPLKGEEDQGIVFFIRRGRLRKGSPEARLAMTRFVLFFFSTG
jgi:hypothetical protein